MLCSAQHLLRLNILIDTLRWLVYIHWMICKHMEIQITDKYFKHIPESFVNANGTTIMWDVSVITDRTILANRPDRVLHDKKKRRLDYWSIWPYLMIQTLTCKNWKLSKYKDPEIEVSRMRKVRIKTVPVIIEAMGTIKKGLHQTLRVLPDQPPATGLQKVTWMSTAHIIHKVLG